MINNKKNIGDTIYLKINSGFRIDVAVAIITKITKTGRFTVKYDKKIARFAADEFYCKSPKNNECIYTNITIINKKEYDILIPLIKKRDNKFARK